MAIDKSLKQHYEMQGGVKNYLGKQKMVKAPKHWLSKPGHVKAKLAYITDEEEQILIDKNLYGSLRGRPNIGPAGLPSLQGGDFGSGGGGSSGGGGGGNGSHDRGGWQHHRAATQPRQTVTVTPKSEPKDEPIIRHHTVDTPVQKLEQKILDQLQAKEKEKFDADWEFQDIKAKAPTTLIPKTVTYDRGVPFTDTPIKTTVGQTLFDPRTSQNVLLDRGTGIGSVAKRIFGESPLEIALNIGTMGGSKLAKLGKTAYDVKQRKGIYGSALGWGEKLTGKKLDFSNVKSTIEKAKGRQFDPKDPIGWTGEKKRTKTFHEPREDGERVAEKTTVQEAVAGKKPLGINLEDIRKKQMIMKTALDEGYYTDNEGRRIQLTDQHKKMLTNYIAQIDQYLVDPRAMSAYGGRIDKALGGRSRDIG